MFLRRLPLVKAPLLAPQVYARGFSAAAASVERPFKILGIQQIAIGGLDKDELSKLWVDTFGLTKVSSFKSERENVDEDVLRLGNGPFAVEVDIMQPLDENKSPKVHVPPLNHIG